MRFTDQQLDELDSFDWFADGVDAIWGEDAYDAITSLPDYRSFDVVEWAGYVHYMFLTRPHLAPTENFCRRVALWQYSGKKVSVAEAEEATAAELLKPYFLGALPRIDSLTFTEGQVEGIVNWLAAGRRRIGGGGDGFAYLDAWFNHPQITSEHIRHFVTVALSTRYVDAELLLAVNSSPLSPDDIVEGLSRTVQKSVVKAKHMRGDGSYRWLFVFQNLSAFYNLPQNRRLIRASIRRKFRKHHEGRFDLAGYYEDESLIRPKMLFQSVYPDDQDIEWEAKWWEAATFGFQRSHSGVKETAMTFGVGVDGIPPGIAMYVSSVLLASVARGDSATKGNVSGPRSFWVLPYLGGARRWIVEQSGMDADNVPFEWVAEILGIGEDTTVGSKYLSSAWKQAQKARQDS